MDCPVCKKPMSIILIKESDDSVIPEGAIKIESIWNGRKITIYDYRHLVESN